LVAFGDSLTSGTGVGSGRDYVSLLSNRTGVPIVNAGRSGDTTATALLRVEAAVLSRDPDIVIVFFGGNDLLQGVPVQRRIANITEIVERIRARGAAVIVVGLASGILDPFDGALAGIAVGTSSTLVPAVLDGILGVAQPDVGPRAPERGRSRRHCRPHRAGTAHGPPPGRRVDGGNGFTRSNGAKRRRTGWA
jgi:hypothetical protein